MVDDDEVTPDLPAGDSWRFGLGTAYTWSDSLSVNFGYELVWYGDIDLDVNRGPLSGRVSGEYPDTAFHFVSLGLNWQF